jgi:small subunit ribosomal protein S1
LAVKKKNQAKKRKVNSSPKKTPQTMGELLEQSDYSLPGFKKGDKVKGVITEKTKRTIYIDINGKSEALVLDREIKTFKDYIANLEVGDEIVSVVVQPEDDNGQTILSLKTAATDALWREFDEKLESGESIKVKGVEVNKGGLIVDIKGLQGFVPSSQFGAKLAPKIDQLINRQLVVKLIEADREKNRIICSEKEISEAELLAAQEEILKKIKIGDVFEGEVTGVMPFGFFVKVDTEKGKKKPRKKEKEEVILEGLVHISEISWEKVDDPKEFYKEGDKVKVKVLAIDKKSGRLNLSIKQLQDDPWKSIEKKYPVDSKVKGEITRLAPFGAFLALEPGIEGLVHISKIPAEKSFKERDKVDCYIESIDKENRRLSLGLVLKEKPVGYK